MADAAFEEGERGEELGAALARPCRRRRRLVERAGAAAEDVQREPRRQGEAEGRGGEADGARRRGAGRADGDVEGGGEDERRRERPGRERGAEEDDQRLRRARPSRPRRPSRRARRRASAALRRRRGPGPAARGPRAGEPRAGAGPGAAPAPGQPRRAARCVDTRGPRRRSANQRSTGLPALVDRRVRARVASGRSRRRRRSARGSSRSAAGRPRAGPAAPAARWPAARARPGRRAAGGAAGRPTRRSSRGVAADADVAVEQQDVRQSEVVGCSKIEAGDHLGAAARGRSRRRPRRSRRPTGADPRPRSATTWRPTPQPMSRTGPDGAPEHGPPRRRRRAEPAAERQPARASRRRRPRAGPPRSLRGAQQRVLVDARAVDRAQLTHSCGVHLVEGAGEREPGAGSHRGDGAGVGDQVDVAQRRQQRRPAGRGRAAPFLGRAGLGDAHRHAGEGRAGRGAQADRPVAAVLGWPEDRVDAGLAQPRQIASSSSQGSTCGVSMPIRSAGPPASAKTGASRSSSAAALRRRPRSRPGASRPGGRRGRGRADRRTGSRRPRPSVSARAAAARPAASAGVHGGQQPRLRAAGRPATSR